MVSKVLALAVFLLPLGCDFGGAPDTKIQYMPDMADGPVVKTLRGYLDPPDHSVAMNAILYPASVEQAESMMRNPFPNSEEVLSNGKLLFETYCVSCHGLQGRGDGVLSSYWPGLPDITQAGLAGRADGFFFHRITFGVGRMPGYGDKTSPNERWFIIHYLRTLQN
jgi:mono/diheme cytochrome c family protein